MTSRSAHHTYSRWLPALCALLLAGCGGGGGSSSSITATNPTPAPTPTTPTPTTPVLATSRVFSGLTFSAPVGLLQAPADGSRWFVVEQAGRVRAFNNNSSVATSSSFVDISSQVIGGGELGLLGMAFHPRYPTDPRVFLYYTTGSPLRARLSVFQSRDGGITLDASSEVELLSVEKPESNHNGGQLAFGPDGHLYVGIGDGGGGGDQHGTIGNGQDTRTLLGKILRLDVDAVPSAGNYAIPAGNPFAANAHCASGTGSAPCPEIYAWGLRNPWRFSFDRSGGALWIADVGQGSWEEINRITTSGNLGWRCREGAHDYNAASCGAPTGLIEPVAEYDHSLGRSITGGYVYRGSVYTNLQGRYVFGDFISGRLWSISAATPSQSVLTVTEGVLTGLGIASFGEASDGELYLVDYGGGGIYRVTAS